MLTTFLDRVTGLFDGSFLLAYWLPTFLATAFAAVILGLHRSPGTGFAELETLAPVQNVLLGAAMLLLITVAAFLASAFTTPVVQTFEGLTWPRRLARWGRAGQAADLARLKREIDERRGTPDESGLSYRRLLGYPQATLRLRPTGLGNILTAAEEHPFEGLGLDSVRWWPRLYPLLPAPLQGQIGNALTPMIGLLNLAALLGLASLVLGGLLAAQGAAIGLYLLAFPGGLILAFLAYGAAKAQALTYGLLVRTAFDLHRHLLLQGLGLEPPKNLEDEKRLWEFLNRWILERESYADWKADLPPGTDVPAAMEAAFGWPATAPSPPPPLVDATLKVGGLSGRVTLRRER